MYLKSGTLYYVHHDNRWENLGKEVEVATKIADAYNAGAPLFGTMAYWLVRATQAARRPRNAGVHLSG